MPENGSYQSLRIVPLLVEARGIPTSFTVKLRVGVFIVPDDLLVHVEEVEMQVQCSH